MWILLRVAYQLLQWAQAEVGHTAAHAWGRIVEREDIDEGLAVHRLHREDCGQCAPFTDVCQQSGAVAWRWVSQSQ